MKYPEALRKRRACRWLAKTDSTLPTGVYHVRVPTPAPLEFHPLAPTRAPPPEHLLSEIDDVCAHATATSIAASDAPRANSHETTGKKYIVNFKRHMLSLLSKVFESSAPTRLGRWCHPMSSKYCKWETKADIANLDNSMPTTPRDDILEDEETRVKLYLLSSFYPVP